MQPRREKWTEQRVEEVMGQLLRGGVLAAASLVLLGGILYLIRYGSLPPNYHVFRGEPQDLRSVPGIVQGALSLRRRGLIQIGLLVLIATPIARVVFSFYSFLRQRDYVYVCLTLIVLAVLLYSLVWGNV